MDRDWPLRWRHVGAVSIYECPIYTATETWQKFQYSQCVWDEETDELGWWPPDILPCNRKTKKIFQRELITL